jgi:hypothetical protein
VTPASPLTTRETLMWLTPAARATSFIVGRLLKSAYPFHQPGGS